jgi:hypothetical protein
MSEDQHFRQSPRAPVELRAQFRRDEPGAALEKGGRVSDLGMGGAFLEASDPPPEGTRLWVTFSVPTAWDPLEVPAEVRWRGEGGFGVRFRALTPGQAAALRELVQQNPYSLEGAPSGVPADATTESRE